MAILKKYRLLQISLIYSLLSLGLFFYLSPLHNVKVASIEAVLTFILLSAFTFVLSRIHQYYHSKNAISFVHVGIISVFSLTTLFLINVVPSSLSIITEEYDHYLNSTLIIRFLAYFVLYLLATNQFWIDKHIDEEARITKSLLHKERLLAQAELSNIQEQFKPHFLFNSLNSISALILFDPDKAREMIQALSDFLRISIRTEEKTFQSIADEFNYLNLYLTIEKIRFEDRLHITIPDISSVKDKELPAFILQPLLENAIKYGLYGSNEKVHIEIELLENPNHLTISISNSYDSDSVKGFTGRGYGLSAVLKKLSYLYGRTDIMKIEDSGSTFKVQLLIPIKQ